MDIKSTSFRFPTGTVERIRALAVRKESMTDVLLRALSVLENHNNAAIPHGALLTTDLEQRVARLEKILGIDHNNAAIPQGALLATDDAMKVATDDVTQGALLATDDAPALTLAIEASSKKTYPQSVKDKAVAMKADGVTNGDILVMIQNECGYSPVSNISKLLKKWSSE